ncbi:replication-relaxation family protein [Streptomyces chartreusis]
MVNIDAGGGDRLALAVLTQYRMATAEQLHVMVAPGARVEQTRRRLMKLHGEGLVDRVTLPRAGRTRGWFVTQYGAKIAEQWPELRGRPASRLVADRVIARRQAGPALTVTETALAFVQDARRRGDVCQPLDWIPKVNHSLGNEKALMPDALLYYRRQQADTKSGWSMLRAFVEVDGATTNPEHLAAKISAYERFYRYVPAPGGRQRAGALQTEAWRQRYPAFPRLLFVLDGTGPVSVDHRIRALKAGAGLAGRDFLRDVPLLATPLRDLLENGPSAPIWRPLTGLKQHAAWTDIPSG